jgi:hypothetical protein
LPERHDAFAWVGRPGKKNLLSANVCGLILFFNHKQQRSTDHSLNSFGDDPKM